MNTSQRVKELIEEKSVTPYEVSAKTGVSQSTLSRILNNSTAKLSIKNAGLLAKYFDVNADWLATGKGVRSAVEHSQYTINQNGIGVPYYDVDFLGGFDLVEPDKTVNPAYYIKFPQYAKADSWVNVTGHSMEPLINHGDMIALRLVNDWHTYLLYGEIYAIVTDEYRTIKTIRKSSKGEDFLRFVPTNRAEYDEQDVPVSIIQNVFQVLGCAKKIF